MSDKKADLRFTIQFSRDNPLHEHVAELLNRQGRKKAKLIVDAILFYEKSNGEPIPIPEKVDKKTIEQVLKKLLKENGIEGSAPVFTPSKKTQKVSHEPTEMIFDHTVEELGAEQLDIIAGALDAFRRK